MVMTFPRSSPSHKPCALVVDDQHSVREALRDLLLNAGYEVEVAPTGEAALHDIEVGRPDVVLLDLCMPGMSGVETLGRIQQIAPSVPVIMVTGSGEAEIARNALRLGAFGYVMKPFETGHLFDIVGVASRQEDHRARGGAPR